MIDTKTVDIKSRIWEYQAQRIRELLGLKVEVNSEKDNLALSYNKTGIEIFCKVVDDEKLNSLIEHLLDLKTSFNQTSEKKQKEELTAEELDTIYALKSYVDNIIADPQICQLFTEYFLSMSVKHLSVFNPSSKSTVSVKDIFSCKDTFGRWVNTINRNEIISEHSNNFER